MWMGTTHLVDKKEMKWEEKRSDCRIFTKIHILFPPGNEPGSSSEEESESDREDEV